MKDLISNCFLCGEKSLHVAGTEESQVMQCINCGYTTSTKFNGIKADNEHFQKLGKDMKNWAVEKNGKIWIPSIITLPVGMLYPANIKKEIADKDNNGEKKFKT
jgi:ribosomal protein L37E